MPGPARAFDESDVIDAALRAFWRDGFGGTKLTTVLHDVGIGRQSLYNAFESKEALYVAALRSYRREHIGGLVALLDGPGSPSARLSAVFERIEENAAVENCDGCFVANAIAEFGRSNADVLREIESSYSDLSAAFARTLDEAVRLGEVPAMLDTDDVAQLCAALVEGASLLNRIQTSPAFAGAVRRGITSLLGLR